MSNVAKRHEYLICIDSDGTVMDTMTIKHERCFGPSFIDVFEIKDHVDDILYHWNQTNLYTSTRGINRFQGLMEILIYISDKYNIRFKGSHTFYHWVETTPKFSVQLLKEEIDKTLDNNVLKLAVKWSDLVNERISKLPSSHEFDNCKNTLKILYNFADLLGVSSANKDAVKKEWVERGLADYFIDISCQDVGSKSDIIANAIKLGYDPDKVIMIGDAVGDLDAATNNDVHFYPIIPTQESQCWAKLADLSQTISDNHYGDVENTLINQFIKFLNNGGK